MCVPIFITYTNRIEKECAFWGKRRMSLVGRAKNSCRCCSSSVDLTYSSRFAVFISHPKLGFINWYCCSWTYLLIHPILFVFFPLFLPVFFDEVSLIPRITVSSLSLVFAPFAPVATATGLSEINTQFQILEKKKTIGFVLSFSF